MQVYSCIIIKYKMNFPLKISPHSCKEAKNYIKKLSDVLRFALIFSLNDTILENNELIETSLIKIIMKLCIHV